MNQPIYPVRFSKRKKSYTFTSIGKNGSIQKIVKFVEFQDNVYNLGFGDFDEKSQTIDDKKVSNNGDIEKVLATVFSIVQLFFNENPTTWIYIEGSTPSRTRLYQIIFNRFYDDFYSHYEIFGLRNDTIEPFQKNEGYESFLIKKLL